MFEMRCTANVRGCNLMICCDALKLLSALRPLHLPIAEMGSSPSLALLFNVISLAFQTMRLVVDRPRSGINLRSLHPRRKISLANPLH
mgnify:CR=1 FL=1